MSPGFLPLFSILHHYIVHNSWKTGGSEQPKQINMIFLGQVNWPQFDFYFSPDKGIDKLWLPKCQYRLIISC